MTNPSTLIHSRSIKGLATGMAIILFTVIVLDQFVGRVLEHLYHKQQYGQEYRTKYSMEYTRDSILIFGSSRAEWLFDPKIFEQSTGRSCYNTGRNGQSILYQYAVLQSILKRHRPSHVILSIDALGLSQFEPAYDRLSVLLPFYETHPEIRPVLELKGSMEKLKLTSAIYPFNSMALPILSGIANPAIDEGFYKGFKAHNKVLRGLPQVISYREAHPLDSIKVNLFLKFIKDCRTNKINITIVCPPYYATMSDRDASLKKIQEIALLQKIHLLDFSQDSFYLHQPTLFSDFKHLNKNGVNVFNKQICSLLFLPK